MTETTPRFADLAGVHARTAEALTAAGMERAFPVQSKVVPLAAAGRDVLVQSPTGSGKTLAFGIPIVEQLERGTRQPHAVILVPTRELAVQVNEDLQVIANGKGLSTVCVYGGAPIYKQAKEAKDAAIVVATPGRLFDMMNQRKIDLRKVSMVVLDEADRMLDMGFQPQVDEIMAQLPRGRQTMLFSATLEGKVAKVAATYTTDPEIVQVDARVGAGGEIEHVLWATTGGTKVDTVLEVLELKRDLTVVFVRTQRSADLLTSRLREHGVRATAIHGGLSQKERLSEYRRFQAGTVDVLVATDVFARGMDLDRITQVVNYDLPEDADTYQHRAGRTGRAGRKGLAVTMVMPNQRNTMRRMVRTLGFDMAIFDDMRRTKRTRREALPEDQWFRLAAAPASKREYGRDRAVPRDARRGGLPSAAELHRNGPTPRRKLAGGGAGDGTVVSFDPLKGFGFIKPAAGGPDVFFHKAALDGTAVEELARGMRVAFATIQHERGARATGVRLIARDLERATKAIAARPAGGPRPTSEPRPSREGRIPAKPAATGGPAKRAERPVRAERQPRTTA